MYDVIVVDPPWAYGSPETGGKSNSAEGHYVTIGASGKEINRRTGEGIDEIIASAPITEWAAENCALYLWTTNPKLPFAFAVMSAWGFTYKTTLTWVKATRGGNVSGGGIGWFYRGASEHVLLGTRGRVSIPSGLRQPNVFLAETSGHSVKPATFYELIELVHPGTSKLDVFARRRRIGWDVWGNEVDDATPSLLDDLAGKNIA